MMKASEKMFFPLLGLADECHFRQWAPHQDYESVVKTRVY